MWVQILDPQALSSLLTIKFPFWRRQEGMEEERNEVGPWIWAYSQKHQRRYWYNFMTKESTWINPANVSPKRCLPSTDDSHYPPSTRICYHAPGMFRAIEDHPLIAIERDKILEQAYKALLAENAKYGPIQGDSKTAISCRNDGERIGLQGIFARIIWYELLQQVLTKGDVGKVIDMDGIIPVTFEGDPAVINEFLDFGRTLKEAQAVIQAVGNIFHAANKIFISMKRSLLSSTGICQIRLQHNPQNDVYTLSYQGATYEIGQKHLSKLLRLYRLHTDKNAVLNDSLFVSCIVITLSNYYDSHQSYCF
jgi:hypothetical protein